MTETTIGTHNGKFHADEVFALAILKKIYPEAKIERTRDMEKLAEMDFRVDVGRKYDFETKDFDHHQPDFKMERENGTPYASAGLIWKHFGENLVNSAEAFEYIDSILIQPIDAADSGREIAKYNTVFPYTIKEAIDSFNRNWDEDQSSSSENAAFHKVLEIASRILDRELKKANSIKEGEDIVKKALKDSEEFIVLDRKGLPWSNIIMKNPKIKFVVFPENPNNWLTLAVPIERSRFELRAHFPESWAGSGKDLEQKSGVKGATFCHKGGFIAAANTKEGAIALTRLALQKVE